MISLSFYLLNQKAASQSLVYVSISNKVQRLRFSTGESFITAYCNVRKKKGTKDLVKKGNVFYFDYKSKLDEIRNNLIRIEMDLAKLGEKPTLEKIKEIYYLQTGKGTKLPEMTFETAFEGFIKENRELWSAATLIKVNSTLMHLKECKDICGELTPETLTEDFWNDLKKNYFIKEKKFSNSTTNKYLAIFKQFLRYAKKKQIIKQNIDLGDLKYLDVIEPFKIALKFHEVEKLINLNLASNLRLDKVRDLFILEIMTGQRFSDMPKVLDPGNLSETNIQLYQKKTGERVSIPLHDELKEHLSSILNKYPDGLPSITNQKFNKYLKEICVKAKFNKLHSWETISGKTKIAHKDYRHNLITSHTGRRTFCTLALKSGVNPEMIMRVTGHKKYDQFREYVKVDDDDLEKAFEGVFSGGKTKSKNKIK